jgi:hypothetical protein
MMVASTIVPVLRRNPSRQASECYKGHGLEHVTATVTN